MGDRRRARRPAVLACSTLLLCVCSAGTALAQTVTGPELQALADRAPSDPRALAQLRAVQQVDGRPVDVGRALGAAEGPALASRLRALTAGGTPSAPATVASQARRDAQSVLDGRRFKPSSVPRPLEGVFRAIGRGLEPVLAPIGRLWGRVTETVGARIALVGAVFVLAGLISVRLVGRRSPRALEGSRRAGALPERLDPDALEREATSAEEAGELDRAVRLRFVAGVVRLDRAGVISDRSSMTTGQLAARLRSGSFAELAAAFDEIAYGGRQAEEADVHTARTGWPQVLAETGPGGRSRRHSPLHAPGGSVGR